MTDGILASCANGDISPQIALSRLALLGAPIDVDALVARAGEGAPGSPLDEVARLAVAHRPRLAVLARLAREGLDPVGEDLTVATAALFDRLARTDPEAAVAFYSLGDPGLLALATDELVALIRSWVAVEGRTTLDYGCGIGRVAIALALYAARVTGVDVSEGMVEQARARASGLGNLAFVATDGHALPLPDASVDLALAVDSFPFIVRAGVLETQLAELARVLRPEGDLLVFNWSYRGDDAADAREAAGAAGFAVVRSGERPFAIWDGTGYHLRRLP